MRRGRPPYANDPAARQRSDAFFEELPAPRASTNAASRLASVLGGRARSRDPSPSARRVPKHAVAFGTTVRSPRVSPHVTPRATPRSSPRNPASAAWTASDRYLARVRERERDVRRDDEGDGELLSDENRSDLYELSDDSIDDHLGAVFPSHASSRRSRRARSPGRSMSPGPRSLGTSPGGDGRVDRRARSGETFEDGASRDRGGAPAPTPSPRSARRRVAFVPETPETFSAVPEPRGATSVPKPVEATRPTSLRARLPRKPELALPAAAAADLAADDALRVSEDGASSSDGSGVDAAVDVAVDAATPSPEPTRLYARRVFEDGDSERFSSREGGAHLLTDAKSASAADASAARGLTIPRPDEEPETHRTLIDSIARKDSGDLLASVHADGAASTASTAATTTTNGDVEKLAPKNSRSVSFGFVQDVQDHERLSMTKNVAVSSASPRTRGASSPGMRSRRNTHTDALRDPRGFPRDGDPRGEVFFKPLSSSSPPSSPLSRSAEATRAWVPPGVAPPRAASDHGVSPSSLHKAFASEMFASPLAASGLEGALDARSPFSAASEASARSASGSAAKAAAAAARRRFVFASAVMGDAARLDIGGRIGVCGFGAEDGQKEDGQKSLVAELRDVARALGEETRSRAVEEAARKLSIASARAEARVATLSEANKAKLARRESAHATRAACRALRHRVRQWRATAGTARLARAAARKWRATARRSMANEAYAERKASAFAAEARLASALGALRDWRSRTAERRGMAELARLAAAGAFRKRARLAFDAWRGEASSARRARATDARLEKKTERFSRKTEFRRLARTFVTWADLTSERRETRLAVDFKIASASLLTLRRCVHAWFGVACRNAPETRAALREIVAEARLRLALRAMADRNRERARIRAWYVAVREAHLRALGHWALRVARRAAGAWRALALAGRRARARRRAHAALARVVDAYDAEHSLIAHTSHGLDGVSPFDGATLFPTPSPLRSQKPKKTSSAREPASREPARREPASRDALRALKTSRRSGKKTDLFERREPLRPVGSSRLAADAALLSNATARVETYAAAPTTPRRVAIEVGAVSAQSRPAFSKKKQKPSLFFLRKRDGASSSATEKERRLSPVSFGGYVSPAAARARLWEAPELSESLRELAPTVWRAAFEEAKEAEEAEAGRGGERGGEGATEIAETEWHRGSEASFEAEGDGAERLLELARRGKRRVAFY